MKISLINKIIHATKIAASAGVLYASTIMPFAYSQEAEKPLKEIDFPEKLTQQTEDFYKNPEKEFDVYKRKYLELALDGVIDSKDVEQLEVILRKTLEEVDGKIRDGNGLKATFPTAEGTGYLKLTRVMKSDLGELQEHLAFKKEWLNSYAAKGDFWNYGTGCCFYLRRVSKGNTFIKMTLRPGLTEKVFSRESFYPALVPDGSKDSSPSRYPKIPELCAEFPAQTKINYWLGLGLGLFAPLAISGMVFSRLTSKGKKFDEEEKQIFLSMYGTLSAVGYLVLDSTHPWIYPTRIIVPPLIYYLANRNVKSATSSSSASSPSTLTAPQIPSKPGLEEKLNIDDLTNPWDIDIPKIEDQKVRGQY